MNRCLQSAFRSAEFTLVAIVLCTASSLSAQSTPGTQSNRTPNRRVGKAPLVVAEKPVLDPARPAIPAGKRRYIVQLDGNQDQDAHARRHGVVIERGFKHALNAFVACLSDAQVERLRDLPEVLAIEQDRLVATTSAQTVPDGVKRIDVEQFPPAMINGTDERIPVDVAVLDTGVQPDHPDLNVVQTYNIAGSGVENHGTAIAGIIGALDNDFGVVGVAPGVRLWSVRMGDGFFYTSDMIAALNYVAAHADQIAVANCSFSTTHGDTYTRSLWEAAVLGCVNQGVVVVASAGNDSDDVAGPNGILDDGAITDNLLPAGLPTTMAVSAVEVAWDQFASYSNYSASNHAGRTVFSPGAAIDVAGPTRVRTTTLNSGYMDGADGTSAAAPHVTGLVALYIATHGRATDAAGVYRIRQAIVDAAQPQSEWSGLYTLDPDSNPEGMARASIAWDPNPPRMLGMAKTPQGASLAFTTTSGYTHALQHANTLGTSALWTDVFSTPGMGAPMDVEHATSAPQGFYRLATLPVAWFPPLLQTVAVNSGSLGVAGNGRHWATVREGPGAIVGDPGNLCARMPAAYYGAHVQVPYRAAFNPATPFSVEFWVKPEFVNETPCLASSFYDRTIDSVVTRAGWIFYQADPGLTTNNGFYLRCYHNEGPDTFTVAAASMTLDENAWYHVVGVFDGVNVILYVNGASSASSAFPAGQTFKPNTSEKLTFGVRSDGYWYGNESLDEPAFYPYALSLAQVQAHYQSGINPTPSVPYHQVILNDAPSGYWRLNEP